MDGHYKAILEFIGGLRLKLRILEGFQELLR